MPPKVGPRKGGPLSSSEPGSRSQEQQPFSGWLRTLGQVLFEHRAAVSCAVIPSNQWQCQQGLVPGLDRLAWLMEKDALVLSGGQVRLSIKHFHRGQLHQFSRFVLGAREPGVVVLRFKHHHAAFVLFGGS